MARTDMGQIAEKLAGRVDCAANLASTNICPLFITLAR